MVSIVQGVPLDVPFKEYDPHSAAQSAYFSLIYPVCKTQSEHIKDCGEFSEIYLHEVKCSGKHIV